jgi:hypothetical protein
MPATAAAAFTAADILGKGPGVPKVTDEYKLDKELGKGAFGTVYLVRGGAVLAAARPAPPTSARLARPARAPRRARRAARARPRVRDAPAAPRARMHAAAGGRRGRAPKSAPSARPSRVSPLRRCVRTHPGHVRPPTRRRARRWP